MDEVSIADRDMNTDASASSEFIGILGAGILTTIIVLLGAQFGNVFIRSEGSRSFIESLALLDGQNYKRVAEEGYSYDVGQPSTVAFFPAYPLAIRWLSRATHIGTVYAEVIVSNGLCLASFVLFGAYLRRRDARLIRSGVAANTCPSGDVIRRYAVVAICVIPTSFFFRMAYSESMFLSLSILVLYAILSEWPMVVIALIAGLVSAVRPVGIILAIPVGWHAWRTSTSTRKSLGRMVYVLPLSCWGIVVYILFQTAEFAQPFAFVLTQRFHSVRGTSTTTFLDKCASLLSWEPIRETYNSISPGYWQAMDHMHTALFSLQFANPIFMIGAAMLIALGSWRKWLTEYEISISIPLLLIPYLTRGYEMRMFSQGRFAAVVFPVYIALAHLLKRLPPAMVIAIFGFSAFLMGTYAALFAAGYLLL